ncbi:MAG: hypothetical protein ACLRQF_04315 [Thomasclavelia ramosa]
MTIAAKHLDLLKECPVPIILTPHFGEFKRLCAYDDELDMIDKVGGFARKIWCYCCFKGS